MTFLAGILAQVGELFFEYIVKRLTDLFKKKKADDAANSAIESDAQSSVDPLKKAETGKEIDDATDSALDHT